ncbi:unnamed protein product [Rhizophagus irregularis]|uniref:Ricin B lectin domain-containing protein n=1 Tax=Rhizophagus irregularis TaxID=588596 RepID=A0A2I1HEV0_9GLOM|nr:hypothetical protein RhiirA4_509829 [Rhizophagus irregularis]CAB4405248.1 unnamed protein product [Rhizophagus irregularis]
MKLQIFLYSLLSAISINCVLIPNTKVTVLKGTGTIISNGGVIILEGEISFETDSNLVEGITYNIINMITDQLNLDSNGQEVYLSSPENNSPTNPYQSWALRKVNNSDNYTKYNIIHVKSGLNLDCNDNCDCYISSFENNSKVNPYQQWMILKYISTPEYAFLSGYCTLPFGGNLSFRSVSYELSVMLTDVVLGNSDVYTKFSMDTYTIQNPSNATIQSMINRTIKKLNSFSLEVKKTESFQISEEFSISFDIKTDIFKVLEMNTNIGNTITGTFTSTTEMTYQETITEEVSYDIQQTIIVPANTSLAVEVTIDKFDGKIPFTAKIKVTASAMRLDENGKALIADVDIDALKHYLQKANIDTINLVVEGNSLFAYTSGTIKLDMYGFKLNITTKPV